MTRSEQIEAAARALLLQVERHVEKFGEADFETGDMHRALGQHKGVCETCRGTERVLTSAHSDAPCPDCCREDFMRCALEAMAHWPAIEVSYPDARPADAEPVPTVWISDTATYSLHEGGARAMGTWSSVKYRDFITPLYASPPAPDRTQGAEYMDSERVGESDLLGGCLKGFRLLRKMLATAKMPAGVVVTEAWIVEIESAIRQGYVVTQADALAALKELVACKDLDARISWNMDKPMIPGEPTNGDMINSLCRRKPLAWAEARRVIAATGEKG